MLYQGEAGTGERPAQGSQPPGSSLKVAGDLSIASFYQLVNPISGRVGVQLTTVTHLWATAKSGHGRLAQPSCLEPSDNNSLFA